MYLNEDAAIKAKLQGLSVDDANAPAGGIKVAVRYRAPDDGYADQTFPLIVLDRVDSVVDPSRAHAGYVQIPYAPEGYRSYPGAPGRAGSPYWSEFPIPMFLDYTVTLLARRAQHLTQLLTKLTAFDYLTPRYGYLVVPQDATVRRLDVVAGPETDAVKDEQGKRLLRAVWRIRTTAELIWAPIDEPVPASAVDLTVSTIASP